MPSGKGTYGSKKGRPPKSKVKRKVKKMANFVDPINVVGALTANDLARLGPVLGRAKVKSMRKRTNAKKKK